MTIWLDVIALAAGVAAPIDHRPARRAPAKARRAGPARRFARDLLTDIGGAVPLRAIAALRRWRRRRKAIAELAALNDHMLRDIGVSRGAIRELVDAQLRHEAEAGAEAAAPATAAKAAEPHPAPAHPAPAGFGLTARPCTQPC